MVATGLPAWCCEPPGFCGGAGTAAAAVAAAATATLAAAGAFAEPAAAAMLGGIWLEPEVAIELRPGGWMAFQ